VEALIDVVAGLAWQRAVGPGCPLSRRGYWQGFLTIAGMVGVVTAVLTGSAAGLLATIAAGHSAVAGFVTGAVVGIAALLALMVFQVRAWDKSDQLQLFEDEQEPPAG
jgi:uncharacterized membrane protein YhaH (DUF805 family)